jgi:hypothetical protein
VKLSCVWHLCHRHDLCYFCVYYFTNKTIYLVGLDIVLQSKQCITDYSSNVGKFIKLWNGDSVIHIFGEEMDLNTIECPAY